MFLDTVLSVSSRLVRALWIEILAVVTEQPDKLVEARESLVD